MTKSTAKTDLRMNITARYSRHNEDEAHLKQQPVACYSWICTGQKDMWSLEESLEMCSIVFLGITMQQNS